MTHNYTSTHHFEPLAKKTMCINWCLTSICNFNCTYCPESLHDGKSKGPKFSQVIDVIVKIVGSNPNLQKFFEFTGGEVTYYKNIIEIARFIKLNGANVGIISNGSRKISFWKKLRPFLDHICLSYHSENQYGDNFVEVAEYLGQDISVHVNVMMKPELFSECLNIANRIHKIQASSLSLQPLYHDMSGKRFEYSPEQLKILEQQLQTLDPISNSSSSPKPFQKSKIYRGAMIFSTKDGKQNVYGSPEILAKNLNNWKGWHCYAGIENLVIDFFGNVKRSWCGAPGTFLGNINTSFNLPKKPVICEVTNCYCSLDMMCTKKI